jgi:hypothetical protein
VTDVLAVRAVTNPGDRYFLSSNAGNYIAAVWTEIAGVAAVAEHAGVPSSTRSDANALYDKTGTDIDPRSCGGGRNALYVGSVGILVWIGKAGYWRAFTVGIHLGVID